MKLYKALKLKKKLAGEISVLMARIQTKNSYPTGSLNEEKYDVFQLEEELGRKVEKLLKLKCAINSANSGIQEDIYRLSELKSLLSMWQGTSVREGTQPGAYMEKDIEYKVQIDEKEKDKRLLDIQEDIDRIQEEIDVYNYTTDVKFGG